MSKHNGVAFPLESLDVLDDRFGDEPLNIGHDVDQPFTDGDKFYFG
ncbi:MAG: hypothetical protein IIB04_07665 [Acidobacteria bacterium]|nr:hypothetical protein [Acidobacteriota bacterium]